MQEKVGNPDIPRFCWIDNVLRIEIGDTIHSAKPDNTLFIFEGGGFAPYGNDDPPVIRIVAIRKEMKA